MVRRIGILAALTAAFFTISGGLTGLSFAVRSPVPVYAVWSAVIGVGFALALPTLTVGDITRNGPALLGSNADRTQRKRTASPHCVPLVTRRCSPASS
jgi:hypothetical protein